MVVFFKDDGLDIFYMNILLNFNMIISKSNTKDENKVESFWNKYSQNNFLPKTDIYK